MTLLTTGATAPVSPAGTDTVGPDASAVSASPNPALVTAPVMVTVRLFVDGSLAGSTTATQVAVATSTGPGQTVDRVAMGEVTGAAGSAHFDNLAASRLALP